MDKTFIAFVLAGIGFLYLTVNFVKDIQSEDERLQSTSYQKGITPNNYHKKDVIGNTLLDVTGVDETLQAQAWRQSPLKEEWLSLFPNFEDMRYFIEDRVIGEPLREQLLSGLKSIKKRYLIGELNSISARHELQKLP